MDLWFLISLFLDWHSRSSVRTGTQRSVHPNAGSSCASTVGAIRFTTAPVHAACSIGVNDAASVTDIDINSWSPFVASQHRTSTPNPHICLFPLLYLHRLRRFSGTVLCLIQFHQCPWG
ncbi:hypothetical protein EI94DRAFT_938265 [Lactarius quietus]|nr:hypothetical protein EI94DRAFT_938265 [Lactarius quietus]